MKQEDKELLLKDLCARLPYGVKVCARVNSGNRYVTNIIGFRQKDVFELKENDLHTATLSVIDDIKPFLRPMSSMTDEEENKYRAMNCYEGLFPRNEDALDYVLSNYFDFRGLIPMGLALEAHEGMYK